MSKAIELLKAKKDIINKHKSIYEVITDDTCTSITYGEIKQALAELKPQAQAIGLLRKAGCKCPKPLLGYRPGKGPRCRLCNMEAEEPQSQVSFVQQISCCKCRTTDSKRGWVLGYLCRKCHLEINKEEKPVCENPNCFNGTIKELRDSENAFSLCPYCNKIEEKPVCGTCGDDKKVICPNEKHSLDLLSFQDIGFIKCDICGGDINHEAKYIPCPDCPKEE